MLLQWILETSKKKNMIKNNIAQLLETEMERKDFLKLIGLGVLAATGITQILKAMSQQAPQHQTRAAQPQSYGGAAYGGVAKK